MPLATPAASRAPRAARHVTRLLAALLVAGCGGSDPATGPDDPGTPPGGGGGGGGGGGTPPTYTVALAPDTATLVVGGTRQLTATVRDAGGATVTGQTVTWTSTAPGVAAVSNGLVTAAGVGTARIVAASAGAADTATVTVTAPVATPSVTEGSLSLGDDMACGLTTDGRAWCWGLGATGSQAPYASGYFPTAIEGAQRFTTVRVGGDHACGLTADGAAYCWGLNLYGQLGAAGQVATTAPVAVSGGLRFASIHPRSEFTVALTREGHAYAWGHNFGGMLGDGTTVDRAAPVRVGPELTFAALSEGGTHLTFGITADGAVYVWGPWFGTAFMAQASTPTRLPLGEGVRITAVSVGRGYALLLDQSGRVWRLGEYGDPHSDFYGGPERDAEGFTFRQIVTSGATNFGITADGVAYAWGDNTFGQLGAGSELANSPTPVPVAGGLRFREIHATLRTVAGLTTDGVAYFWGRNTGMFGNGVEGDGTDRNHQFRTPTPPSEKGYTVSVSPAGPTLTAGESVDVTVRVTRVGGGFTTDAGKTGVPGAITLTASGLPAGVTATFPTSATIGPEQTSTTLRLTASSGVAGGPATLQVGSSAAGMPARSTSVPVLVTSASGGTGLDLVCPSSAAAGSRPGGFPTGYHCMVNSGGNRVPGKYAVPTLTGSPWWVDTSAGVCVSWKGDGSSVARFKGSFGAAATQTSGHWGLIVRRSGVPEGPENAQYLFTSNLDAQTQLLSFDSTRSDDVVNNYAFQKRSSCPW